eukprot:GHVS01023675.1.p1 GENE.GHVS01023675.1~~GHVS01023675.1.p1  ORF type:complete len:446 (+),score=97.75 GHVS01023675.1:569-1906(+)
MDEEELYEYESEEEVEDVEMSNLLYEAEDNLHTNTDTAFKQLRRVSEEASGVELRFRALQKILQLSCRIGLVDRVCEDYEGLLKLLDRVTRNEAADAINSALDEVAAAAPFKAADLLDMTMQYLHKYNIQALWFSVCRRLSGHLLKSGNIVALDNLIAQLHQSIKHPSNRCLFELYALEVEVRRLAGREGVEELVEKAQAIRSAAADPKDLAIIGHEHGHICMTQKNWNIAYNEFFEAFRNYQEAASSSRGKRALICAVFCNMMAESQINPFDSQEARSYQNDVELTQIIALRTAFEAKDMKSFLKVLVESDNSIPAEPLLKAYLPELIHTARLRALHSLVKPYERVGLNYLAQELGSSLDELRTMVFKLICHGDIKGCIDDVNTLLEVQRDSRRRQEDVSELVRTMNRLRAAVKEMVELRSPAELCQAEEEIGGQELGEDGCDL